MGFKTLWLCTFPNLKIVQMIDWMISLLKRLNQHMRFLLSQAIQSLWIREILFI
uniref:Uncharacterized protein LOC105638874 isoform X1 n=1 Tax=Rhizophora mucronata TaxID=61149 RepID=A0A2P2IW22_RHIMU